MEKVKNLYFTNIAPYVQGNVPQPIERDRGEILSWGDNNLYPQFLWDCYLNSPTLQAAVNSIVDFTAGNAVECTDKDQPNRCETWEEFIRKISLSKLVYGGYAIQVIKNILGDVNELYCIDMNKVRLSKEGNSILISEKWNGWSSKAESYPVFSKDEVNSIYFSKGHTSKGKYPLPLWNAAVNSVVTEKKIGEYHLNAISNGFSSSFIINFNNGSPQPEQQREIEQAINEKFCGSENAGRIAVSFNDNKENAVTVEKLDSDNFDQKYSALKDSVEKTILQSLRVNPALLGYNPNSGLAETEFEKIYGLFNRTVIYPVQKDITSTIQKISGWNIRIVPFNTQIDA